VLHSAEPGQVLQEFLAKGRFQPGEIGTPATDGLRVALLTEQSPDPLALASLDAVADKIATFGR
jgi:hypothetical protein